MRPHKLSRCLVASLSLCAAIAPAAAFAQAADITLSGFEAVESTLDEAAITEILSGNLGPHADQLASLDAQSILIETLEIQSVDAPDRMVALSNLAFTDIADGIAASASIGAITVYDAGNAVVKTAGFDAADIDIGAMLTLAGEVEREPSDELVPLFSSLAFSGWRQNIDGTKCAISDGRIGAFAARLSGWDALEALDDEDGLQRDSQSSEAVSSVFSGFSLDGLEFGGVQCKRLDESGRPTAFALGSVTLGSVVPGFWPETDIAGASFSIFDHEDAGDVGFDTLHLGAIDFAHVLALTPAELADESQQGIRRAMPHFSSFAVTGLNMDIPDGAYGDRIDVSASLLSFDLGGWRNGLPTAFDFVIEDQSVGLRFAPEQFGLDNSLIEMAAFAARPVTYRVSAHWDEDDQTITIDPFSYEWSGLGAFSATATFANVTPGLFSYDEQEMTRTALQMSLAGFGTQAVDNGIVDFAAEILGSLGELGVDQPRLDMAKLAADNLEAEIPEFRDLWWPVIDFLRFGGTLSMQATPANESANPVPFAELAAMSVRLELLFDLFDITTTSIEP